MIHLRIKCAEKNQNLARYRYVEIYVGGIGRCSGMKLLAFLEELFVW